MRLSKGAIASMVVSFAALVGAVGAQQEGLAVKKPEELKLADACRLKVVGGLLTIESSATTSGRVSDAPGTCILRDLSRDDTNQIDGYDLSFAYTDHGAEINEELTLGNMRGPSLMLTRQESGGGAMRTIQYIQRLNFGGRGPGFQPPISLQIDGRGWRGQGGIRASDFNDLIKTHPQETEQFIRPMLRDLHNEDLLPPANLEAVQVLAADMPPNTDRQKKIDALIQQLDADAVEDRDAASAALKDLHGPAIVALLKLDVSKLSPEQHARVDELCQGYKLLTDDEIKTRRTDLNFLLACLASDDQPIRDAAVKLIRDCTKKEINFDTGGNAVARSEALTALHDDLLPVVGK